MTPSKVRKERDKEALRHKILAAARDMFAAEGYENMSMRKLADKVEYSPATIYAHFDDKEQLIKGLCEETFTLLNRNVRAALKSSTDPIERLKAGLKAYVKFGIEHPNHYRVTFMTPHIPKGECAVEEDPPGVEAFQCLVDGIVDCMRAGLLKYTDVPAMSQGLWCVAHGLASLQITHSQCFPWVERDHLIDLTLAAAIEGLCR